MDRTRSVRRGGWSNGLGFGSRLRDRRGRRPFCLSLCLDGISISIGIRIRVSRPFLHRYPRRIRDRKSVRLPTVLGNCSNPDPTLGRTFIVDLVALGRDIKVLDFHVHRLPAGCDRDRDRLGYRDSGCTQPGSGSSAYRELERSDRRRPQCQQPGIAQAGAWWDSGLRRKSHWEDDAYGHSGSRASTHSGMFPSCSVTAATSGTLR
jgi:hypothetical protein